MGLTADQLRASLDALAAIEPGIRAGLDRHGYPDTRIRERGHVTMLRTIVGQQVSVASAAAIWGRLEALVGPEMEPPALLKPSDEEMRAVGLSRQKLGYIRSLAELVASGEVDFAHLPTDDEEAIALLTKIKGIGRWSAEIYLLFAEGRTDIWPAGDLAVQVEVGELLGHAERPSEKLTRELAESWSPHRGAAAIFAWHHYGARLAAARANGKGGEKLPL